MLLRRTIAIVTILGMASSSSAQAQELQVSSLADIHAPPGFEVRLFGKPPKVHYPVCLAAAATGEVFIGVDRQGSLGKQSNGGRILKCIDTDGDGTADDIRVFAELDHPRGLHVQGNRLWVLHPPFLSCLHDMDGDGQSDQTKTLVTGITTNEIEKRGADHTTNGIRMGIDGWIYIAVGDFGFIGARGTDGRVLSRRGGGVVRVRPDGTQLEIFAWGLRNIVDVAIDPLMRVFTRDNTNDGGGWNVRLSHIIQSGNYGYPSLYTEFPEEIMPPISDYGGGSGCGSMFLYDERWPRSYANCLYTCDWGTETVYRHNMKEAGATLSADQTEFLKVPRPTDIDVDGNGRMYVSSWKNGKFDYSGPDVGFVAQIVPQGLANHPVPVAEMTSDAKLVELLTATSAKLQLYAQRELLRRGPSEDRDRMLMDVVRNAELSSAPRVAGMYTLKQIHGKDFQPMLIQLARDPVLRSHALRALCDYLPDLTGHEASMLVPYLADDNPRVQAEALVGLGRIADAATATQILPLTIRSVPQSLSTTQPAHAQADPGRILPLLAISALVQASAVEACLDGLYGPYAAGAISALSQMHDARVTAGLTTALQDSDLRHHHRQIATALLRLYHREGPFEEGWWGTRPDRRGPYFDRQTWEQSQHIQKTLIAFIEHAAPQDVEFIHQQLKRHTIDWKLQSASEVSEPAGPQTSVSVPEAGDNPQAIANRDVREVTRLALETAGRADVGKALFTRQSCTACHSDAEGQEPKGPHLMDIGKRYSRQELVDSILTPGKKIAQGFEHMSYVLSNGKVVSGFVVTRSATEIVVRDARGITQTFETSEIEQEAKQPGSVMPDGLVNNLTPAEFADLLAYLESLRSPESVTSTP